MVGLDLNIVVVGLPVVVAIILVLFFNGLDKDVIENRNGLYPKIAKCIETEFKKYQKAEEPEKQKMLNKIITLDKFRINLRKTRDIRNYGFLYTIGSVVLIIILLLLIPYVPLNVFLTTSTTLSCYPNSNTTHTFSCYPPATPTSAIVSLFLAEGLLFLILLAYQKFSLLWKMSKIIIQNTDEDDKNLTDIVCKIFKTRGYATKSKS